MTSRRCAGRSAGRSAERSTGLSDGLSGFGGGSSTLPRITALLAVGFFGSAGTSAAFWATVGSSVISAETGAAGFAGTSGTPSATTTGGFSTGAVTAASSAETSTCFSTTFARRRITVEVTLVSSWETSFTVMVTVAGDWSFLTTSSSIAAIWLLISTPSSFNLPISSLFSIPIFCASSCTRILLILFSSSLKEVPVSCQFPVKRISKGQGNHGDCRPYLLAKRCSQPLLEGEVDHLDSCFLCNCHKPRPAVRRYVPGQNQ